MPTSALHVARTGLEAQDARMRVIANNLANVGTTGFKRDRANFATLAYQDMRVAGQRSSGETAYATGLNLGTGVAVQSTSQIMTQGALNTTGNGFDLALDGEGYFAVQLPGGQTGYTRAGNFTVSAEGQLVTQQGYPVEPAIAIPEGASAIAIAPGRQRIRAIAWRSRSGRTRPVAGRQLHEPGWPARHRRQFPHRNRRQRPGPAGCRG